MTNAGEHVKSAGRGTQLIEDSWQKYREQMLPTEVVPVLLVEMRQAYFAGAAVLLETMLKVISPGSQVTGQDIYFMEAVDRELRAFGQELEDRCQRARQN